ncbi:hypothetical protein K474DRAFT_1667315 [Panus rudis PR-1116 ss-1]|nr:hypothetical protein K474DRAFT_1667315 [Panus rudis PR-1116 ss-1]
MWVQNLTSMGVEEWTSVWNEDWASVWDEEWAITSSWYRIGIGLGWGMIKLS